LAPGPEEFPIFTEFWLEHVAARAKSMNVYALLDSESVSDYRPVFTFAAVGATWTHGYRVQRAPMNIASSGKPELTPAANTAAPVDQRSRNASLLAFNTGFSK